MNRMYEHVTKITAKTWEQGDMDRLWVRQWDHHPTSHVLTV